MQLITSLTPERYHQAPAPKHWSVAQAANHIYLSERLSLDYLRKKAMYPDTIPPYSLKSELAIRWLQIALHTPYKAKAPKTINMWDNQTVLLQGQLEENWKQLHHEMAEVIRQQAPVLGSRLVYKHPFVGRLSLRQMLMFMNAHMAHHIRQIRYILRTVSAT